MSNVLQVQIDDKLKVAADNVFSSMGLDIATAIRMFLVAAVDTRRIPFDVKSRTAIRPPFEYESMKGDIWMADDFNAPIDAFEEYMK